MKLLVPCQIPLTKTLVWIQVERIIISCQPPVLKPIDIWIMQFRQLICAISWSENNFCWETLILSLIVLAGRKRGKMLSFYVTIFFNYKAWAVRRERLECMAIVNGLYLRKVCYVRCILRLNCIPTLTLRAVCMTLFLRPHVPAWIFVFILWFLDRL